MLPTSMTCFKVSRISSPRFRVVRFAHSSFLASSACRVLSNSFNGVGGTGVKPEKAHELHLLARSR